jgi:hypothetical protein
VTPIECPREQDLMEVLTTDRWPDRCDEELRRHAEACPTCRDLVTVLTPLGDAWALTRAEAQPPGSGMVWWRAQMRARQEAARAAARPVAVAQAIGAVVAIALVIACVVLVAPWFATSWASSQQFLAGEAAVGGRTVMDSWLLTGGLAVIAATTLAVYIALAQD